MKNSETTKYVNKTSHRALQNAHSTGVQLAAVRVLFIVSPGCHVTLHGKLAAHFFACRYTVAGTSDSVTLWQQGCSILLHSFLGNVGARLQLYRYTIAGDFFVT